MVVAGVVDRLATAGLVLGESHADSQSPQHLDHADAHFGVQLVYDAGNEEINGDFGGLGQAAHFPVWVREAYQRRG